MTSLPPGCCNAENENYGGLLLTLQKFNCHLLQRRTENGYCPGGDFFGQKFWIQSSCACKAWSIVALRKMSEKYILKPGWSSITLANPHVKGCHRAATWWCDIGSGIYKVTTPAKSILSIISAMSTTSSESATLSTRSNMPTTRQVNKVHDVDSLHLVYL